MRSNHTKSETETAARMELKYCEHCGGLWVRECGAGTVYCPSCAAKVEDLPVPKKRPKRVNLPVRPRAVVESVDAEDEDDLEAGGAA